MELTNEKIREYIRRLLLSRMRILATHGFYGLLLMNMNFALDSGCMTAATDGVKIYFNPKFLEELCDSELDFVMMHEILHVVLQHVFRGEDKDPWSFNIACDIVVNSNILLSNSMNLSSITLKNYGVLMHKAPDGEEGYKYTVEEVYKMLPHKSSKNNKDGTGGNENTSVGSGKKSQAQPTWDDHSKWRGREEEDSLLRDEWSQRFVTACEAISIKDQNNGCGSLPAFAERMLKAFKKPQTDWRTILDEFVQEDIVDYSFTPPDRRFSDSDFFLPDFNEPDEKVADILFMIDTSGSMSDDMIFSAYSEIKGAIDQYDGKLMGWLGFFDAAVIPPKPFENEEEFKVIKAYGGGGTDFYCIFKYVQIRMSDKLPASIVILTDGKAIFPPKEIAMGIPVLWIINNEKETPPWGKVARIKV